MQKIEMWKHGQNSGIGRGISEEELSAILDKSKTNKSENSGNGLIVLTASSLFCLAIVLIVHTLFAYLEKFIHIDLMWPAIVVSSIINPIAVAYYAYRKYDCIILVKSR